MNLSTSTFPGVSPGTGPGVTLFDYHRSSASYRVRIALNLKGIAWASVPINLLASEQLSDAHRARNPQGQVPMLEIDGLRLIQSLAIIDYLDATRPDPALIPRNPAARAQVMAQALVIVADTHPIGNMRFIRQLTDQFGADEAAKTLWRQQSMALGLSALEALAVQTGHDGPFLGGDAPNLADICLVPQLYNARRFDLPLEAYPQLVKADAAASALAAFADAHPDRVTP